MNSWLRNFLFPNLAPRQNFIFRGSGHIRIIITICTTIACITLFLLFLHGSHYVNESRDFVLLTVAVIASIANVAKYYCYYCYYCNYYTLALPAKPSPRKVKEEKMAAARIWHKQRPAAADGRRRLGKIALANQQHIASILLSLADYASMPDLLVTLVNSLHEAKFMQGLSEQARPA